MKFNPDKTKVIKIAVITFYKKLIKTIFKLFLICKKKDLIFEALHKVGLSELRQQTPEDSLRQTWESTWSFLDVLGDKKMS